MYDRKRCVIGLCTASYGCRVCHYCYKVRRLVAEDVMMGMPNGIDIHLKEPEAYAGFPLAQLLAVRKPSPENKDASDTEDDDDNVDDEEAEDDQDEDAGEE
ncbi:uncharacterized protein LOC120135679 isoform X2 [Hibiscus syriacus]|uniref:uncharacterized protein LOC120135679 isoform X2 n=1 Tax=Hibiscus syriacus TaxID=106335 RepID=UPI0019231BBE|nr:uncharacterized protein LOC120135679 isoform X2 [Hibiscus syriacus]